MLVSGASGGVRPCASPAGRQPRHPGSSSADTIAQAAPEGLDAVADVVGGDLLSEVLPSVREGGRWVIAGAVAGPVVSFDLRRLYLHNVRLIGSSMHTPQHFARLVDVARLGAITPRVAGRYDLSDIHAAQRDFVNRGHVGKIVLVP